ncbi:MAG TPA: DUF4124 domain-containing protein [Gallionella sp.]
MKHQYAYALIALLACPVWVHAEIYKSVDADGHVTYSSTPAKGATRLDLPPLPTMAPPARTATPADFPKVDNEKQKERDELRRKILQDELAAEEKQLAEARKNLEEASPEVYRGADGKTYRNVAKYEENTKVLAAQVDLHEKNVSALKAELSKLK